MEALDLLRGVAVLGILLVNMQWFAMPNAAPATSATNMTALTNSASHRARRNARSVSCVTAGTSQQACDLIQCRIPSATPVEG
jgi:hypothetical protein